MMQSDQYNRTWASRSSQSVSLLGAVDREKIGKYFNLSEFDVSSYFNELLTRYIL